MPKNKTKVMTLTSLMIAAAIVLRFFGVMIPFAGAGGMRINVSGFFSKLPAVLFGPCIGTISSALIDIIGCFVKPEGSYIPLLTVTAAIGGFIVGFMWKYLKNASYNSFKKVFLIISSVVLIFAIFNFVNVIFLKNSYYSKFLYSLSDKKRSLFIYGSISMLILCITVYVCDALIARKNKEMSEKFIKLLIVLLCANLVVTTLNTFVLRIFIPSLSGIGFMAFYIPRVIEEIIMTIVQCYGISLLLAAIEKAKII